MVVEFELQEYSAEEGDTRALVIVKTGRNAKPVTVVVSAEDQSATSKSLSWHSLHPTLQDKINNIYNTHYTYYCI